MKMVYDTMKSGTNCSVIYLLLTLTIRILGFYFCYMSFVTQWEMAER